MEAQPQVEDMQAISHQHDNGEIFEANNLEAARGMCPVLGKMSLEEVGLLLELETMGKEQIAAQQKVPNEKPVIEKVEKVQTEPDEIKKIAEPETKEGARAIVPEPVRKITEPTIEEIGASITSKLIEADMHTVLIQHAEDARIANSTGHGPEEANEAHIVKAEPAESWRPMSKCEEVHRQVDAATFEVGEHHETRSTVEEQFPAKSKYGINPSDKSPLDAQTATEREAADALPLTKNMKLTSADEATSVNMAVLAESETLMAEEQGTDLDRFVAAEVEEEVIPGIINATQFAGDQPTEFIQAESLPLFGIAELPAPMAQIETTMAQLVETLENDELEIAIINTILKEIIALPTELEITVDNEEKVLEEKLEELFVELFEEADISYSPDLIESFLKLTKSHYLEQLLEITVESEEAENLPHEIGTREFLQKLQHGLSTMKQAVINFYELGKSIMRLYAFSYS